MDRYKDAFKNIDIPADMAQRIQKELESVEYSEKTASDKGKVFNLKVRYLRGAVSLAACVMIAFAAGKAGILSTDNLSDLSDAGVKQEIPENIDSSGNNDSENGSDLTMAPPTTLPDGSISDASGKYQGDSDKSASDNTSGTAASDRQNGQSEADKPVQSAANQNDSGGKSDYSNGNKSENFGNDSSEENISNNQNDSPAVSSPNSGGAGTGSTEWSDHGDLQAGSDTCGGTGIDLGTVEELQNVVDFQLKMPQRIPSQMSEISCVCIADIIQITYSCPYGSGDASGAGDLPSDTADISNDWQQDQSYGRGDPSEIVFRMAQGQQDISGDYNIYKNNYIKDGYNLKGNENISLVNWSDSEFSYSLSFSPEVSEADAIAITDSVTTVK